MKSFESHAAAMASAAATADDTDFETTEPILETASEHTLAGELRAILDNRNTASIGAFADVVNRLMGELALAEELLKSAPAGLQRPGPTRAHVPMTEEQEQRIVDWFVAKQAENPWSRLR